MILACSTPPVDALAQQSVQQKVRSPELEMPQRQTATGVVKSFTRAPTGEVDGFELEDGTTVHYPPSLQKQVAATITKNSPVRVTGLSDREQVRGPSRRN
jgi:hypothetical protein